MVRERTQQFSPEFELVRLVDHILCLKQFGVCWIGTFSSIKDTHRTIGGAAMHQATYFLAWCGHHAVPFGVRIFCQLFFHEGPYKDHELILGRYRVPLY